MRKSVITRTMVGYDFEVIALNDECQPIKEHIIIDEKFNIENPDELKKALKVVRKVNESVAKIISVNAVEKLYSMSEEKFLELAEPCKPDERRNKVTKTICKYLYECVAIDNEMNVITKSVALDTEYNLENTDELKKALKEIRKVYNDIAKIISTCSTFKMKGLKKNGTYYFCKEQRN